VSHEVHVAAFASRTYPVYVGHGIFNQHDFYTPHVVGQSVFIITQASIPTHFLKQLSHTLGAFKLHVIIIAEGEAHKTLADITQLFSLLQAQGCEKNSTLIAFGGGIVGDMTGFAAACYHRGIAYLQVPTTLIAQADAALGGKTGVNLNGFKNSVGAIYQPRCVIIDPQFLLTLTDEDYLSGLAEVVKYGLIQDAAFFTWLEAHVEPILARDMNVMLHAVSQCARMKCDIVALDEHDQGVRRLLNFGHTFGHALEKYYLNTAPIKHGQAVAIGMRLAAWLSCHKGLLTHSTLQRILNLLERLNLSGSLTPLPDPQIFFELMQADKKVLSGKIEFILLRDIGQAFRTADVTLNDIAFVSEFG
jgi:3-dehydroquinate synthase